MYTYLHIYKNTYIYRNMHSIHLTVKFGGTEYVYTYKIYRYIDIYMYTYT